MSNFSHLSYKPHATEYLAHRLNEGNLVLFLGAGTSAGFGLPNWLKLVNELRIVANLPILSGEATTTNLQEAADEVEDILKGEKLSDAIRSILYKDFDSLSIEKVLDNKLLVAVTSLLMGSKRGRVTRVVTLNYDSMLEWFLELFGFIVQPIYKLPALEGSEDVRVYHPHGYIPHSSVGNDTGDQIILSQSSADRRLGSPNDKWFEMTRHILSTGVGLFIGMSENTLGDRALSPLFLHCSEQFKEVRPLGVWLLYKSEISKAKDFSRKGIVPLQINDDAEMIGFLLEICQKARLIIKKPHILS